MGQIFNLANDKLTALPSGSTPSSGDLFYTVHGGLGYKVTLSQIITSFGLGTASTLAFDTDGTLSANSDSRLATQKAIVAYVANKITGLLDFKGSTDCSANPNYPSAVKGDAYVVSVAGKIGGASGIAVDVGDVYFAIADNAGGTQASVGASWDQLEHNLVGALLSANNLSDVANAATARNNILPTQTSNNGKYLTTDGTNATWASVTVPSAANPSATMSNAAVNGSALTFMRSDASPAIPATFSWAQTFSSTITVGTSVTAPLIVAPSDGATAIQVKSASGNVVMTFDTTNGFVGFGTPNNSIGFGIKWNSGSNATSFTCAQNGGQGANIECANIKCDGTLIITNPANSLVAWNSGFSADVGLTRNAAGNWGLTNGSSTTYAIIGSAGFSLTPAAQSSGTPAALTITGGAHTGITASTECNGVVYTPGTKTWVTGNITTQRETVFNAPTYAAAGSSTITTAVNSEWASPIAGANVTLTKSIAGRYVASADSHVCLVLVPNSLSQTGNMLEFWNPDKSVIAAFVRGSGFQLQGQQQYQVYSGSISGNYAASYSTNLQLATAAYISFSDNSNDAFTGRNTSIWKTASGVVAIGSGAASGAGWLQNSAGRKRNTADVTNATASMSNLSDLTITLIAGRKYTGKFVVKCNNSVAAEGIQFDFNGGTATMTSFWASAFQMQGGTVVLGTGISTSLAGVINFTTITGETVIEFNLSFVCNQPGTIVPRAAENSHTTGTATIELGSWLWLEDMPN